MSASGIIAKAYQTVFNNPVLWIFGLFLTSGFNLHWAWLHERAPGIGLEWSLLLPGHPGRLLVTVCVAVVTVVAGTFLNSFAKSLLVLHVSRFLGIKRLKLGDHQTDGGIESGLEEKKIMGMSPALVRESRRYIVPIAIITLFTVGLTILGALVLFVPPLKLIAVGGFQTALIFLAVLIFLLLIFLVSCLNVFASFFVVLYQKSYRSALNLATDLMVTKWQTVLGFVLLLMTIYAFSLAAATGVLFVSQHLVYVELGAVGGFHVLLGNVGQNITWALTSLVLLLWLGMLNAFFNTALLLLFTELVKPEEASVTPAHVQA